MRTLDIHSKVALTCPGSICLSEDHPEIAQRFIQDRYQLKAYYDIDINRGLSPEARAEIFLRHVLDDEVECIIALRGGEGCADLIPFLEQRKSDIAKAKPKILLGFSDYTALLVYFSQVHDWPAIHGSSPLQFALQRVDQETERLTMDSLLGRNEQVTFNRLQPLNDAARCEQVIDAEMTGGCLSLIDVSVKDCWELDAREKIIFFEDVGEKAHKVLRTLKYLDRIGMFARIKGLIFGDFTCDPIGCDAEEQERNREAIAHVLSSFARHHDFPVLQTDEFGHGQTNKPIFYRVPYCLELGEQPRLRFRHPAT